MMQAVTLAVVERVLTETGIGSPLLDRIMERLRKAAQGVSEPIHWTVLPDLAAIARWFHKESLRRTEIIGHQIEDPSWNMLLTLFADTLNDRPVSTTSAVYASGVPATTALRYIELLARDGLVERKRDSRDQRKTTLSPTPATMTRMEEMIRRFCVAAPAYDGSSRIQ